MKKGLLILSALLITVTAFAQNHQKSNPELKKYKGYKKSSSGLLYKFHLDVKTPNATPDQFMILDMKITLIPKDTIIRNTWKEEQRLQKQIIPSTYSGSLEEALLMTSAGDSVSFLINADSMWAKSLKQPLPNYIPKGSYVQVTVKSYRCLNRDQYKVYADSVSLSRISAISKDFKKSSSGLLYKFHRDVQTPNATPEQFMVLDMKIKVLPKDTMLRNSWLEAQRLQMYVTPSTYGGSLEEAFLMVSAGDSVSFLINADSMWAKSVKQPLPSYIAQGSYLHFTVRPYRIFTRDQYNTYLDSLSLVRKADEEKIIEQVIREQHLTGKRTPGGTYYVNVIPGTGVQPTVGQKVKVHYTGYLLNGTKFDSSVDRGTPFEFPVGKGNVIKGWDEGIPLMKVGEKGLLFIPSDQGYGSRGAGGSIPPNSILVFEVELLEVK